MTPLRWSCKSTRTLAADLKRQGFLVGRTKVGELLKRKGYSLQANRKTREGKEHPDRNAQFEHINRRVMACQRRGQPAVSVDTKKKEVLGNRKNPGRTYRRKGKPREVNTHDFPDVKLGKAIPYGVYDLANNDAWVSVGSTMTPPSLRWLRSPSGGSGWVASDTQGQASVDYRRQWWQQRSSKPTVEDRDPGVRQSDGPDPGGLPFSPRHQQMEQDEHRLFCHITRNWQGIPLETHELVVNLIGSTRTTQGLEVHAWLDQREYPMAAQLAKTSLLHSTSAAMRFRVIGTMRSIPRTNPQIR